jgi:hypothetical protein
MFVKVPSPVAHAQRRLITLIENRQFTGTARSWGITPSNITSLHGMVTGKIQPSFIMIFNLRQYIEPVEWFYNETEKMPEKKEFSLTYTRFDRRTRQHIIKHPTVGVARLEKLILGGKLQTLCRENGLHYKTLYGYAKRRKRHDGVAGYHSRPSYQVIRALRHIIHPDEWFIFPEEINGAVSPEGIPPLP